MRNEKNALQREELNNRFPMWLDTTHIYIFSNEKSNDYRITINL